MDITMANKNTADFFAALEESADQLDRLNQTYPNLASEFTRDAVEEFRRLPIILHQTHKKEPHSTSSTKQEFAEETDNTNKDDQKLIETAQELLAIHSFDDVLDILQTEHGVTLNLAQLVNLVGNNIYLVALRREAHEFQANAISIPQIAQLWSDLERPPIGDSAWTATSVSMILEKS
jgi:hypothetical protein